MNMNELKEYQKQIARAEGDAILIRWRMYRAILEDPVWTDSKGHLKEGKTEKVQAAAKAAGAPSSETEVRKGLLFARRVKTEQGVGDVITAHKNWFNMCQAGFRAKPRTNGSGGAPDPRDASARELHAENVKRMFEKLKYPVGLFADWDDAPEITLKDIKDNLVGKRQILDQKIAAQDSADEVLTKLVKAVKGDLTVTYGDAVKAFLSRSTRTANCN